ncbi:MAG: putative Zn-dependent peptidase [Paraglaciecola sp.]|jgi:predicted Zn-dependent peptidase
MALVAVAVGDFNPNQVQALFEKYLIKLKSHRQATNKTQQHHSK